MEKNENYVPAVTIEKGGKQIINLVTSTGFSSVIAIVLKCIFDKEFKYEDIHQLIGSIAGTIVVITPLISSVVTMVMNFKKHYTK